METCYLDIAVIARPEDMYHIIGRIYPVIHRILSRELQGTVGVGFPDWLDHEFDEKGKVTRRGTLGRTIRLVGPPEALEKFSNAPELNRFTLIRAARLYPIHALPNVSHHVRVIRDRKREKETDRFLEKAKRRNQKRGLEPDKKTSSTEKEYYTTHFIPMTSSVNDQRYSLHIRREPCKKKNGTYSNFGFSKDGSSIPEF